MTRWRILDLLRRGRRERRQLVDPGSGELFEHGRFDIVEEDWPKPEPSRARDIAGGRERWLHDA